MLQGPGQPSRQQDAGERSDDETGDQREEQPQPDLAPRRTCVGDFLYQDHAAADGRAGGDRAPFEVVPAATQMPNLRETLARLEVGHFGRRENAGRRDGTAGAGHETVGLDHEQLHLLGTQQRDDLRPHCDAAVPRDIGGVDGKAGVLRQHLAAGVIRRPADHPRQHDAGDEDGDCRGQGGDERDAGRQASAAFRLGA